MKLTFGSIAFFVTTATIGLYLFARIWKSRRPNILVTLAHGVVAATAGILLTIHTFKEGIDSVEASVLLILSAITGAIMVHKDVMGKTIPKGVALLHGFLALGGIIFLVIHVMNRS